jgi:phage terminase large subunit-like protein
VACINDLIRRAFLDGKAEGRYAYIAPFYRQAKSIAWDYLLKFSEPVRVNANASELWVELLNGARIRLFGADNPDSLRGLYLDGVILDEYADMRPRV